MMGLKQAFRGNSRSARTASPIAGMYTLVIDSNDNMHIVIVTMKLERTSNPNLITGDFELVLIVPRFVSLFASVVIIAPHAQPVQMKRRLLRAT